MKRWIVLALFVMIEMGLTLMIPAAELYSADKEQRFPLLKLEQLNDQQRPLAHEILKVASIGISGPFNLMFVCSWISERRYWRVSCRPPSPNRRNYA
jgi:hypothetical protein